MSYTICMYICPHKRCPSLGRAPPSPSPTFFRSRIPPAGRNCCCRCCWTTGTPPRGSRYWLRSRCLGEVRKVIWQPRRPRLLPPLLRLDLCDSLLPLPHAFREYVSHGRGQVWHLQGHVEARDVFLIVVVGARNGVAGSMARGRRETDILPGPVIAEAIWRRLAQISRTQLARVHQPCKRTNMHA